MKHPLSEHDRASLDAQINDAEKMTGAQIVLAITKKSDSYPEIPWKAFAAGVSVSGLSSFIAGLLLPVWVTNMAILVSISGILASGIILAALSIVCRRFARIFLSSHRKETETLQYAQSLFLSKELFATKQRSGILLLLSEFERQVVVVPDKGLQEQLTREKMNQMIAGMSGFLKKNEVRNAFESGLAMLRTSLSLPVSGDTENNELSNEIITEGGL